MKYEEIEGDLIRLALQGKFDVIAHGCNCFSTMSAGIAPQMAKAFGCDTFPLEEHKGDINKLGNIDFKKFLLEDGKATTTSKLYPDLFVINAYTQYNYGQNHQDGSKRPLDHDALRLCLRKINKIFRGDHVGLPKIGCGLAGGIWNVDDYFFPRVPSEPMFPIFVSQIIQQELKDCNVTVVCLPKT